MYSLHSSTASGGDAVRKFCERFVIYLARRKRHILQAVKRDLRHPSITSSDQPVSRCGWLAPIPSLASLSKFCVSARECPSQPMVSAALVACDMTCSDGVYLGRTSNAVTYLHELTSIAKIRGLSLGWAIRSYIRAVSERRYVVSHRGSSCLHHTDWTS